MNLLPGTAQKMMFSMKDFCRKLCIWSHLLKKSVMENFILYSVDTRRKLKVHKTFRRRPGHLLNVLCTFHLHLVSRGFKISLLSYSLLNRRYTEISCLFAMITLHKKWCFPLRISAVNVTKSAVSCRVNFYYWLYAHSAANSVTSCIYAWAFYLSSIKL